MPDKLKRPIPAEKDYSVYGPMDPDDIISTKGANVVRSLLAQFLRENINEQSAREDVMRGVPPMFAHLGSNSRSGAYERARGNIYSSDRPLFAERKKK